MNNQFKLSHPLALSGYFRISFICVLGRLLKLFKPEVYLESSRLRYLHIYVAPLTVFLKKIYLRDSNMDSNMPMKTFRLPFHCTFVKNISSRSYLCILSSIYIAIKFNAKKRFSWNVIKTSILYKTFKFFWIIISMINLGCWIPFQKKDAFTGINI